MAARYVRIPFGSRLEFPDVCPFTGSKNPKSVVTITRHETQMILPMPMLGHLHLGKKGRMVFPASRGISIVEKMLAVLPLLFLAGGFVSLIWTKDDRNAWRYPVGGFILMYLGFGAEWLWLRRARIVRIGMSSLEVRFASQEYAEEFCRLNELPCQTTPRAKRARPTTKNGVR
jgi:hypothetical protein